MALLKTAVFLASRFEEFNDLRKRLKELITNYPIVHLTPIDLNDGNVSHRPPLVECLGYVRRAEFMILLLGDTYGSPAPKSNKSFTHLEYEEAIKDGSRTRVLVFGIGEHYRGGRIRYSDDKRLAGWQKQVEENHTVGFFDPEAPVEFIAKSIFEKLLAALYEMRFGALAVEGRGDITDDLFEAIEDNSLLDDAEVRSLEERNAQKISLVDDRSRFANTLAAVMQPAAVAALEQREEAQRALDISEYGVAIHHLKRALEYKPLELISNYWLAQLYVAMGRKEKASEALEMAERAGRIAERDSLPYRASAAYVIAARAARLAGRADEAIGFARQAIEVAPRFARAHIELARQYSLTHENKSALKAIRDAFDLYPKSLREVLSDPVFRSMRKDIDELLQKLRGDILCHVVELVRIEGQIASLAGKPGVTTPLEGKTISQLIETARQSSRRQYEYLCFLLNEAEKKAQEFFAQTPKLPPTIQVSLRFNRPGRALIVEWFRQPGDVIQPGETVFSYQYEGSAKINQWTLRERTAVRMIKRTGDNGTQVSSENPTVFEHIPASTQIPMPSRIQQLRAAINEATGNVENVRARLFELMTQKKEATLARESTERRGFAIPGMKVLLASVALLIGGLYFLFDGRWVYGFLVIAVSLFLAAQGNTARKLHFGKLHKLRETLRQLEQEEKHYVDEASRHAQKLALLQNSLAEIEKACDDAKTRARKALELFEGISLCKGTKLLPFPSIFGARAGEVIRMFEHQLAHVKNDLAREIDLQNDLPEWLADNTAIKSRAFLARVIEESDERLALSRWQAYSIVKEKQ